MIGSTRVHFHVFSVEEEESCGYQGDVKILNVHLNLFRINIDQCDLCKLGHFSHGFGQNVVQLQANRIRGPAYTQNKNCIDGVEYQLIDPFLGRDVGQ
ncbi:hypothetical protein Mapa_003597 [Marchantia paleacea]|nr:hypothetical protein Mapa_003597 [Marchantia paleacea]